MTVFPALLRIIFALLFGLLFVRTAAAELHCTESAGWVQARWYVDQCRLVVVASHALCRADLNCPLLQDEIRRGCALTDKVAPPFCVLYRRPGVARTDFCL